jgi:hypothetical protein
VVILLILAVVAVFAMLAGLIVTSLRSWKNLSPVSTPSPAPTVRATVSLPTPSPSPAPAPTFVFEEGIWSQVQAARLFDQIAHQVEIIRGLAPRAEVPLSFLDEPEMTRLLERFQGPQDTETLLRPYAELGLLPDRIPIQVQPHRTAGVYLPEQKQLYVTAGRPESSADDQGLLAHAYIHALQDQHFDLGAMDDRATTTDEKLAIQALVEGDAVLVTASYLYGDITAADWDHVLELVLEAERPSYGEDLDNVEAWTRLERFPYAEGQRFVSVLFQIGGWQAVNDAYIRPPRSAEQVLHPEHYLGENVEPVQVVLPDLGGVLGDDWDLLVQDTLGEFVVGLYLQSVLSQETSWQAASGWGGDTFAYWEGRAGERLLVWRTIWDGTADAVEFERALAALVSQRYVPAWPVSAPRGLGGQWWEINAGAVCVLRVARYVLFVQAPDLGLLADVVESLP